MKNQTLSFTVLAAVAAGTMEGFAQSPQSPDASKPNILFIITDQQSYDMMSCMGNKFLHTPHMDRLTQTGIRFEKVYCANPVSAPSRFTMFTGRHCSDIGTRGNRLKDYHAVKHTIADILKESALGNLFLKAGYQNYYAGKTHFYGGKTAKEYGFTPNVSDGYNQPAEYAEKLFPELAAQTDRAPFLFVTSFINPHDICYIAGMDSRYPDKYTPEQREATAYWLARKQADANAYNQQIPPLASNFQPIEGERPFMVNTSYARQWTPEQWGLYQWMYCRLTENVDALIGRVLTAMERAGLDKNTIIVFTSDHGDMNSAHGMIHKSVAFDECQRVPLVFTGPGVKKGIDTSTLICSGTDMVPTLCDLAGVDYPQDKLPGISLKAHITGHGKKSNRKTIITEGTVFYQITDGRHKFTIYEDTENTELLTDLVKDKGERTNFINHPSYAGIKSQLKEQLMADLEKRGRLPLGRNKIDTPVKQPKTTVSP